jgi:hypothetical protein
MAGLTLAEVVEIEKHRIKKMFPPGTLDLVSIVPDPESGLVVVVFRACSRNIQRRPLPKQ